jgi:anti-sigma regulatory factor (Ser/Thr protein kinase)
VNVSIARVGAEAKGLVIKTEISENISIGVIGNSAILSHILLNLLSNAVKFTDTGSIMLIADATSGADGDMKVSISVIDTGPGIPEGLREKLFEPFERGVRGDDTNPGGHGLGLSIMRQLCRAIGATVTLESAVGVGSTFTIATRYPVAPALPTSPANDDRRGEQKSSAPLSILVADDVLSIQMVLRGMLEKHGHVVVCASNGRVALEAARERLFDFVLMDIQMPEMNGLEMTGLDRDEHIDEAKFNVMTGYIRKPIGFAELRNVIEKTITAGRLASPVNPA